MSGWLVAVGCVAGIVKLEQYLQFAVTVNVSHTGVVGYVRARERTVVHLYFLVILCPRGHNTALDLCLAAHNSFNSILTRHGTALVRKVGNRQRLGIYLRSVAIDIVRHVIVFFSSDTPAAEYAAAGLHRHQSPVYDIGGALCPTRHYSHSEKHQ